VLVAAAMNKVLAIVPEMDRSYSSCFERRRAHYELNQKIYLDSFGPEAAQASATCL
jgi:hypothetical protein